MQYRAFQELRKFVAPEFIFGVGALSLAGQYGRNLGGSKALIVSDPGVAAAGWTQEVQASLDAADLKFATYTDVSPNPHIDQVQAGAKMFADERCDMIVVVGGGSAIDCAKLIGVVAANGGNVLDFVGVDRISTPMPPTICMPTTAGTAADVSQFAVVRDPEQMRKLMVISKAVVPDISLVDPRTLTTMDRFLAACTGVDALAHAMEAYVSLGHSPLTDLHALQALRLISSDLLPSLDEPDNLEYRTNMMLGSLEAGLAFSNASLGAVHAMAHGVGGLFDLPHGLCNASVFDQVVDFNFPKAEQRYIDIASAMGLDVRGLSPQEVRKRLVADLRELLESTGIRKRLSECGLDRTEVHELAERAMDDPCVVTNPRPPSQRDLEVIYEESL